MNKYKFLHDKFTQYGYKIFPVTPNEKTPMIDRWQLESSCDNGQLIYWLENARECNFALPAYVNNLFIIDIDRHGEVDGYESFTKLLSDLGLSWDDIDTLKQTTPSNGIHLIFKSDSDLDCVKNSSNTFDEYPGIDIRTKGYILIEPSVINGREYKLSGDVNNIKEVPTHLKDFIVKSNNQRRELESQRTGGDYYTKDKVVEKGNRDDEIFSYVKHLYNDTDLSYDEISALAHAYNKDCFQPPLSDSVIDYKVKKLFEHDRRKSILIRL